MDTDVEPEKDNEKNNNLVTPNSEEKDEDELPPPPITSPSEGEKNKSPINSVEDNSTVPEKPFYEKDSKPPEKPFYEKEENEEENEETIEVKPETKIDCLTRFQRFQGRYEDNEKTYYYFIVFLAQIIQFSLILTIVSICFATDFHEYFIESISASVWTLVINTIGVCVLVYIAYGTIEDSCGGKWALPSIYIVNMVLYMFLLTNFTEPHIIKVGLIIVLSDLIAFEAVIIIFKSFNYTAFFVSPVAVTIIEIILFQFLYIQDGSIIWRLSLIEVSVLIYFAIIFCILQDRDNFEDIPLGVIFYNLGLFVPVALALLLAVGICLLFVALAGMAQGG